MTGARIEWRLMYRKVEHTRISIKNILDAIAVMDIVVNNHHALKTLMVERILGGNGYIVEKAETHRFIWSRASRTFIAISRRCGLSGCFGGVRCSKKIGS